MSSVTPEQESTETMWKVDDPLLEWLEENELEKQIELKTGYFFVPYFSQAWADGRVRRTALSDVDRTKTLYVTHLEYIDDGLDLSDPKLERFAQKIIPTARIVTIKHK